MIKPLLKQRIREHLEWLKMTEQQEKKDDVLEQALKIFIDKKIKEQERQDALTDEQYKEELKDDFIRSLKEGVMISRRESDIYIVQDNDWDWKVPRHVIRLKLTDDGKIVQFKAWSDQEEEEEEEDLLRDDETPPLVEDDDLPPLAE